MKVFGQRPVVIALALLLCVLVVLAVACQAEEAPTPGNPGGTRTQPTQEAGLPTAIPNPLPESVDSPEVAFTLTILHTGQVYGETEPCG